MQRGEHKSVILTREGHGINGYHNHHPPFPAYPGSGFTLVVIIK
jgi:hypothetical protein